jgi:hypothetical protein
MKNPSCENWVVPCGRTDRHDAATNRFTHFCETTWEVCWPLHPQPSQIGMHYLSYHSTLYNYRWWHSLHVTQKISLPSMPRYEMRGSLPPYCFLLWLPRTVKQIYFYFRVNKVMQSRNRPDVAQRVPGGLDSQISMTFGTWRRWGYQPHTPAASTSRIYSWYLFSLGVDSTPGPWYGRKEYVTEKSSNTTGNRSRDRPTSRAAP